MRSSQDLDMKARKTPEQAEIVKKATQIAKKADSIRFENESADES